jgi:glycosyltransferase involved in cell wall biosynthesis
LTDSRVILDISSLARWIGPPVGMTRVEHELAAYVIRARPDIVLSIYDPMIGAFRTLDPAWAGVVAGLSGAVDTTETDFRRHRTALQNLLAYRYVVMMRLERWRLTSRWAGVSAVCDLLQRAVLAVRPHRFPFADAQGERYSLVPYDLAVGEPIRFRRGDIVFSAGSDWTHKDIRVIARLREEVGIRFVTMCFDIIPLLFPQFYSDTDVQAFRSHWMVAFATADAVLFISRQVEQDARRFCADTGVSIGRTKVVPMGFAPPALLTEAALPEGVAAGRFVLFVSTIEPRKGHAMLLNVWRRLLDEGVPQRLGYKLVLVGRRGWMVDPLMDRIGDRGGFENTVVHLESVGDGVLAQLYRDAAFCVYPSRYEGFGLPIIEAFAHGKAVIASSGGAIPEVVGDLSPCLDPQDESAWFEMLRLWLLDPEARAPFEARIRTSFAHPSWSEAVPRILVAATDEA